MIKRDAGFTLIELMIAVILGLLAIAAVGNVFLYTSRSYKQDDKVSRTQDNLRFAMAQLTLDIEMAGFFAQVNNPSNDVIIGTSARDGYTSATCTEAWVFDDLRSVDTIGNATASAANAKFPCIDTAVFQPGTDVLAIKRVNGNCVSTFSSNDNLNYFLRTNGYESVIYQHITGVAAPSPTGTTTCPLTPSDATVDVYRYVPAIWYVGINNGVPNLCREKFSMNGQTMAMDCVAEGIEDMQLEFGMDVTGPLGSADGIADYFTSFNTTPSDAERAQIVAVRVHLLARSIERDVHYKNKKSYVLGNRTHDATNDGYYRKTLSSVVLMRNPANRISPYALPE